MIEFLIISASMFVGTWCRVWMKWDWPLWKLKNKYMMMHYTTFVCFSLLLCVFEICYNKCFQKKNLVHSHSRMPCSQWNKWAWPVDSGGETCPRYVSMGMSQVQRGSCVSYAACSKGGKKIYVHKANWCLYVHKHFWEGPQFPLGRESRGL